MRVVVRLAQGGRLAWPSRFHAQGSEGKVGVGSEGRGRGVPGGRWEVGGGGWAEVGWGHTGLGDGCIFFFLQKQHCWGISSIPQWLRYLLYLRPTLQSLSHTLEALSSELSPVGWKQDNHNTQINQSDSEGETKKRKKKNPTMCDCIVRACMKRVNSVKAWRCVCVEQYHHCSYLLAFKSKLKCAHVCRFCRHALISINYICFLLLITVITSDVCCKSKTFTKKKSSNFKSDRKMCRQPILWPDEFLSLCDLSVLHKVSTADTVEPFFLFVFSKIS